MTEIDRNLRRKMLDAFKVRFHDNEKSEGYDDRLMAALEQAIAVRDAAQAPATANLIDALAKVIVAIETDDSGAIADTFWMPDSIIKGCTVVDYIQMAINSHDKPPVAWWYRDPTGCVHMGTDMMLGMRHQNEAGAKLHYLYGDDPDDNSPPTEPVNMDLYNRICMAREIAVAVVDLAHGYTMEFSGNPAAHKDDYDRAEVEVLRILEGEKP